MSKEEGIHGRSNDALPFPSVALRSRRDGRTAAIRTVCVVSNAGSNHNQSSDFCLSVSRYFLHFAGSTYCTYCTVLYCSTRFDWLIRFIRAYRVEYPAVRLVSTREGFMTEGLSLSKLRWQETSLNRTSPNEKLTSEMSNVYHTRRRKCVRHHKHCFLLATLLLASSSYRRACAAVEGWSLVWHRVTTSNSCLFSTADWRHGYARRKCVYTSRVSSRQSDDDKE